MVSIAVYGAGGIGAYFGGRLAQAGADVSLIARGNHLEALQNNKLQIESIDGDFELKLPATDDPAEIGPVDYVLVCVKSFDTPEITNNLDPLIDEETAVISLQNGVTNEEVLANAVGEQRVLGGVAYIFSTINKPGVVAHTGGPAHIIFGELDESHTERAEQFYDLCESAEGIEVTVSDDIWVDIWGKFAFISAQAGMTAAVGLPIGEIRDIDESWAMFERIIREVAQIAAAEGSPLADGAVAEWLEFGRDLDANSYSSLHYDMTHGKRMELEEFHGAIVEYAVEHGINVPASEAVYAILKPWAERNATNTETEHE